MNVSQSNTAALSLQSHAVARNLKNFFGQNAFNGRALLDRIKRARVSIMLLMGVNNKLE
jgi:hypothetical protein